MSTGSTTAVSGSALTVISNPFQAQLNSGVGAGTITAGQSGARIGSFVFSASSAEGINVSTITLKASTTFAFANLIVKVNGVQFGDPKSSVVADTSYTFSGSSPFLISAGGSVTVDVYADVLSTATAVGSSYNIKLTGASAVGAITATTQTLKATDGTAVATTPIIAQAYTISTTGGNLTIAKDASTPAAYQAVMGKTGQSLAIWRFTADSNSDKNITDITVSDLLGTAGNKAMFKNLQFYKGGVATGPSVVSGTASGTAGFKYTFRFTSPVVVPSDSGISLELRGDVASYTEAGSTGTSNSIHTFRIEKIADVKALSAGGSLAVTIVGPAAGGDGATNVSAITVARTKLTVTSDATGITTSGHISSAADDMAVFVFTADPAADVTVNTVTLKLGGSSLTTVTVSLIDSDNNATWGAAATNERWNKSGTDGTASSSISFFPAYPLTAGATKRIKVRVDTIGATSGNTAYTPKTTTAGTQAQWYIDNDTATAGTTGLAVNALCWGDGTSTCGATGNGGFNLETKVLPIYGPALQY